ncbi:MAG: T9SS type A sorting domain-containing protein [Chitinophagales bacterium]
MLLFFLMSACFLFNNSKLLGQSTLCDIEISSKDGNTSTNNIKPQISNENIIWQGSNETTSHIYQYNGNHVTNISALFSSFLTSNENHQIDGNNIVWHALKAGKAHIYLYDGTTVKEISSQDSNNTKFNYDPQIDGNNVVWAGVPPEGSEGQDHIYLYDGIHVTEISSLDGNTSTQNVLAQIDGNNIVWRGNDGFTNHIYLYNGTHITKISASSTNNNSPRIKNGIVTWSGYNGTSTQVYQYEIPILVLKREELPTTNSAGQKIYIAEVCGGISSNFVSSGGFASINEFPSENAGCIQYQVVYTNSTDWTLTVIDINECTSLIINSLKFPNIPSYTVTPETCPGEENGAFAIEVEGGDSACEIYTYTCTGPAGFNQTSTGSATSIAFTDLASGSYDVRVTDCAGTTTKQNIYVSRANSGGGGGGRGRGRSGGCKTAGGDDINDVINLTAYPNPFSQQTLIEFALPEPSKVWLSVYTIEGKKVAKILEGEAIEGSGLQRYGFAVEELQGGVYILELQTESGLKQYLQLVVLK